MNERSLPSEFAKMAPGFARGGSLATVLILASAVFPHHRSDAVSATLSHSRHSHWTSSPITKQDAEKVPSKTAAWITPIEPPIGVVGDVVSSVVYDDPGSFSGMINYASPDSTQRNIGWTSSIDAGDLPHSPVIIHSLTPTATDDIGCGGPSRPCLEDEAEADNSPTTTNSPDTSSTAAPNDRDGDTIVVSLTATIAELDATLELISHSVKPAAQGKSADANQHRSDGLSFLEVATGGGASLERIKALATTAEDRARNVHRQAAAQAAALAKLRQDSQQSSLLASTRLEQVGYVSIRMFFAVQCLCPRSCPH